MYGFIKTFPFYRMETEAGADGMPGIRLQGIRERGRNSAQTPESSPTPCTACLSDSQMLFCANLTTVKTTLRDAAV